MGENPDAVRTDQAQTESARIESAERRRIDADDVSWALRAVTQASTELESALSRRLALKQTDYDAMAHVMSAGDTLGPNDLARRLEISPATTTEVVDRLEAAGHLRRVRSQTDRRRVELHASPESVGRIMGELEPLIAGLDRVAAGLDPAQRETVIGYLRAVSDVMRRFADEPAP